MKRARFLIFAFDSLRFPIAVSRFESDAYWFVHCIYPGAIIYDSVRMIYLFPEYV